MISAPSLFDELPVMPRPVKPWVSESEQEKPGAPVHLVTIVVDGEPVPKGRPRVRMMKVKGKLVPTMYSPKETANYEDKVRSYAYRAFEAAGPEAIKLTPLDERPVFLRITAYVAIPESWSQKKKLAALRGEIFPLTRPDWDNYGKIISDALNNFVYRDDSLVTDAYTRKRYSDNPRMEVEVYI